MGRTVQLATIAIEEFIPPPVECHPTPKATSSHELGCPGRLKHPTIWPSQYLRTSFKIGHSIHCSNHRYLGSHGGMESARALPNPGPEHVRTLYSIKGKGERSPTSPKGIPGTNGRYSGILRVEPSAKKHKIREQYTQSKETHTPTHITKLISIPFSVTYY